MSAAPIEYDALTALDLHCDAARFEELSEDEAVWLLTARFRGLTRYGWDWRTAALLAVMPELPVYAAAWPDTAGVAGEHRTILQ
ncbi:MAG TPA: hypothetical protein VLB86_13535 [Gaiellaceae bacterium]|nr:hypothetical protein [Gaiellaceae bacterium]